MNDTQKQLS